MSNPWKMDGPRSFIPDTKEYPKQPKKSNSKWMLDVSQQLALGRSVSLGQNDEFYFATEDSAFEFVAQHGLLDEPLVSEVLLYHLTFRNYKRGGPRPFRYLCSTPGVLR